MKEERNGISCPKLEIENVDNGTILRMYRQSPTGGWRLYKVKVFTNDVKFTNWIGNWAVGDDNDCDE